MKEYVLFKDDNLVEVYMQYNLNSQQTGYKMLT